MKLLAVQLFQLISRNLLVLLPLLALTLAGCATTDNAGLMDPPTSNGTNSDPSPAAVLHVGDTVVISFDGLPTPLDSQNKTINADGTFTLSDIGTVKAAGKTTGELEDIIHDLYVPGIYKHLTVTVKAGDRVFYVRGEVFNKGRQIYVGPITVTKAITSAGDFTDFANRRNVVLTRANGKRYKIDCDAILNGKTPDPPVYPGDQIEVMRRRW
ncbi:MAG TPA: polysaccharide biosynthesis/export family protein [Verrucomicrobiae bacterium]